MSELVFSDGETLTHIDGDVQKAIWKLARQRYSLLKATEKIGHFTCQHCGQSRPWCRDDVDEMNNLKQILDNYKS